MDLKLNDKVAFIAGSSRGIGLAIARAFLGEGAKVVVTGRNKEILEEVASSLAAESDSERVLAIQGDMTKLEDIQRSLETAVSTFSKLDIVVANVGSGKFRNGWEFDLEEWQSALSINLLGGMQLARMALTRLIAFGGGSIIFISSIAGCEAINAPILYSAAKAALQSAMKSLSRLVGPLGVRVNAVAPGNIFFPGSIWEQKMAEKGEFFENYIHQEVPLQRFGRPEEIADVVVFLASERASFINGSCVVVDGGQTRSF